MSSQRTNESDIVDLTQVESSPSPPSNANRMVPDGDSDIEEVFIQDMAPNEESRRRNRELRRQRLLALGIDEGAESAQAPVLVVHPPAPEVIVISDNEDNEELNHPIIEAQEDLFGDERRRRRSRRDWHELEAPWPTGLGESVMVGELNFSILIYKFLRFVSRNSSCPSKRTSYRLYSASRTTGQLLRRWCFLQKRKASWSLCTRYASTRHSA